jgi:anti-anti-sigma factor
MDLEKAAQLEAEFERLALSGKKKIYLDFSNVEFLCSYIKRVLIKFYKTWKRAGIRLGIQNISDYSKSSLKMAGLMGLFTLSDKWQEECGLLENSATTV